MAKNEEEYQASKNQEQNENHEANKKTAKVAAKAAATYFAPEIGGAAVDALAKTKVGDKILNEGAKAIEKNPMLAKASKKLNDSGAIDAADKGLNMLGEGGGAVASEAGAGAASSAGSAIPEASSAGSSIPEASSANSMNNNNSLPKPDLLGQNSNKKGMMSDSLGGGSDNENSGEEKQGESPSINIDITTLLKSNTKLKLIIVGFFFWFLLIGGIVTILAGGEDGKGDGNETGGNGISCSSSAEMLEIAESQLGNNEANGTHAKYLSFLGLSPSTAWCAAFVSWVANEAGIDEKIIIHSASVSSHLDYYKKAGTFRDISSNYEPVAGDLIIWKAKNSRGTDRSHIGFVKSYDKDSDKLTTIEGNASNAVRENIFTFSTLAGEGVVGFSHQECSGAESIDNSGAITISNGQSIILPSGLGTHATREFDLASSNEEINYVRSNGIPNPHGFPDSSTQRQVQNVWIQEGAKHDDKGFCKLKGRYIIAATSTFGKVGDVVDFYMSNGTTIHTVLGDAKNQDDKGCTKWGHSSGKNVLEFLGKNTIGDNPYYALGLNGQTVVKAVNGGSILK